MPRIARVVGIGLPHHITQRGNYGQDVFAGDADYLKYSQWLQEYSTRYGLSILAYCLMQNHVHFIAIPNREDSLSRTFNSTHMRYAQYFNKKMGGKGHLWQGRFYSCILDEPHFIAALRYVERNPVRAKLVEKAWDWKWSSAAFHINGGYTAIKLEDISKFMDMPLGLWKKYIDSQEDEKFTESIRKHTLTGRPLGRITFILELEKRFGRRLLALPRGGQKKGAK
jgi:putative transposase